MFILKSDNTTKISGFYSILNTPVGGNLLSIILTALYFSVLFIVILGITHNWNEEFSNFSFDLYLLAESIFPLLFFLVLAVAIHKKWTIAFYTYGCLFALAALILILYPSSENDPFTLVLLFSIPVFFITLFLSAVLRPVFRLGIGIRITLGVIPFLIIFFVFIFRMWNII